MRTLLQALVSSMEALHYATTVPHSPALRDARKALDNPRRGDLVVVVHVRSDAPLFERIGVYAGPYHIEDEDGDALSGHTITLLDGRDVNWTNATILRVPSADQ